MSSMQGPHGVRRRGQEVAREMQAALRAFQCQRFCNGCGSVIRAMDDFVQSGDRVFHRACKPPRTV